MKLRRYIFIFSSIFINQFGFSQEASMTLSPKQMMIGDHLNLELRYKSKGYNNTIFPIISDSTLGNFRIVELLKIDTLFSGNDIVISHKFHVTCFEDSLQVFPSLVFQNAFIGNVATKPVKIEVASPNIDSAQDIKPIHNIMLVPLSKEEILNYLLISFLLLLMILFVYLIYVKFILKENLFDREKPEDPPHVVALSALKVVENETLWQMGKIKEYYDKISDILRTYMNKRFGLKALEQTTSQVIENLKELKMPVKYSDTFIQILQQADLAKFAKETHEGELHLAIMKDAYKFVQDTQMSNDVNKRTNALQVRKFYAQNSYGYKSTAINQFTMRALIFGLIATIGLLCLVILAAYLIPVDYLLSMIANQTFGFFIWFIFIGVIITAIYLYYLRSRMIAYLLVFDYNSIILKDKFDQKSVFFDHIESAHLDRKKNLIITDRTKTTYLVPKHIEYFPEVKERIDDIILNFKPLKA